MEIIRGHTKPHIFKNGRRISINKDDARKLSWDYYKDVFEKQNIPLTYTIDFPEQPGECRILKELNRYSNKNSEEWIIQYKLRDYDGWVVENFTLPKSHRGVAIRDILAWLLHLIETDGEVSDEMVEFNVECTRFVDPYFSIFKF